MRSFALLLALILHSSMATGQTWLTYTDETASRLIVGSSIGANDPDEKDYAWGDIDQDGDIDLVIVRKLQWMASGGRRNVLLMNEGIAEGHAVNGVLVNRTGLYATSADDGGQGFLDLTIDRDVQLVDVNGDGWLDMVTATALSQGQPKTISHPRVYRNLGEVGGVWQGFRYEEARTPTMPSTPNFCGIAYGDVTGDGFADLYFSEYNTTLEDRLWINNGSGTFTDESTTRMTYQMRESEFGVFTVNADVNGDGVNDIIKCRSNGSPYRVSVAYNDPLNEGTFSDFQVVYTGSPYYVELGDLNNDGLLDMFINDDGVDRFLTNTGNNASGQATFLQTALPPSSNEFAGRSILADMNNDGFIDVLQADAAINGFGCARHLRFWRNDGNAPNIAFVEESGGIPISQRLGTWDVGAFDLNGDGWKDMVIGTCSSTRVWIADPPGTVSFAYPTGQPSVVDPEVTTSIDLELSPFGVATIDPAQVTLHVSVDAGPFVETTATHVSGDSFTVELPAVPCLDTVRYYVRVETAEGGVFVDPLGAPVTFYTAVAADGLQTVLLEDGQTDVASWGVVDTALTAGSWEAAIPNGTATAAGPAAPSGDASGLSRSVAFVTQNGLPGGAAGSDDIDGGPTCLTSPLFDLSGTDAYLSFDYWLTSSLGVTDTLEVSVSNDDGNQWTPLQTITAESTLWESSFVLVSEFVAPTAEMRIRFCVADQPNDSITEAGIDNVHVQAFVCTTALLRGDCNDDGSTNIADAVNVLGYLFPGMTPVLLSCRDACDHNDDGSLDISDAVAILGYLFGAGSDLPEPFAACGGDPTADPLDCTSFANCP